MVKDIRNTDAVARKPKAALIRATNHRLEILRKKKCKKKKIVERQKTEAIAAKCCTNRGGINLLSREEKNYKGDTSNNTDPEQAKY